MRGDLIAEKAGVKALVRAAVAAPTFPVSFVLFKFTTLSKTHDEKYNTDAMLPPCLKIKAKV